MDLVLLQRTSNYFLTEVVLVGFEDKRDNSLNEKDNGMSFNNWGKQFIEGATALLCEVIKSRPIKH